MKQSQAAGTGEMQKCRKCGETLPIEMFGTTTVKGKHYRRKACKLCIMLATRSWYEQAKQNPDFVERQRQRYKRYYEAHREKVQSNGRARIWRKAKLSHAH